MKNFILIISFLISAIQLTAQVQGVSAEKLGAINPSSIHIRTVEFEPALGYLWAKKTFDNDGRIVPLSPENDSITILRGLGFRFTYGFANNFEAGGTITTDLNNFSLGIKYTMLQHEKFSGAAILGTTLSNESDIVFRNTGFFGKTASLAGGFSFANKFGKRFSIDYDFQYQNLFDGSRSYADNYFIHADAGYMLKGVHLMIAGLAYQYNHFKIDREDAYLLTLNLGAAVMTGRTFILVFNFPFDLIGRNTDRFNGFTFALTITLD
jgi:hypothetical protein